METGAEVIEEAELEKLRQFDLDWRFGPCTGNEPTPVPRRAACPMGPLRFFSLYKSCCNANKSN